MSPSVRASLVLVLFLLGASARAQPGPTVPPDAAPARANETPVSSGSTDAAAPSSPVLHEHGSATGYETTIEAPAPTSAASAETIRDRDLRLRPYASPEDILRVVQETAEALNCPEATVKSHTVRGLRTLREVLGVDADLSADDSNGMERYASRHA